MVARSIHYTLCPVCRGEELAVVDTGKLHCHRCGITFHGVL